MDGDTPAAARIRPAEENTHVICGLDELARRRRWRVEAAARAARENGVHIDALAMQALREGLPEGLHDGAHEADEHDMHEHDEDEVRPADEEWGQAA